MRPFAFVRAADAASAVRQEGAQFLAGGTNLLDLMKLDVAQPQRVVDINALAAEYGRIELDGRGCVSAPWCAWPRLPSIR